MPILFAAMLLFLILPAGRVHAAGEPVAHWRFDEGTGTSVYDEGPRAVTGSFMTPNPTWSTDVPSVSFSNPYSLSFTSTGDGVQFTWPSALNFSGTEPRSFSFWYKPTANGEVASGNYDRIISWTGDGFEIAGTYGDVAVHRLAFYDGSWRDTGYDLTVGTWYNIMFTYDGTNVKLYVAGVEKFSGTSAGRDINGTLYIGVRHTGDEGINGRIDDVRIYDYALTTTQISNIVSGSDNPDAAPAPTLSGALVPADNATNVNGSSNLVMTFNRVVQGGTGTIIIKKSSDDSIVETIAASGSKVTGSGTRILTINPSTTLADSTSYYVQVQPNAVRSGSGVFYAGISDTTSWNFTTGDYTAPSVSTRSPADDATGVSTSADLVLTFDQITRVGTGTLVIKKSSDDSTVETITLSGALVSGNGSTELTINPSVTLAAGTSYYITWTANAFKDTSGNHMAAVTSASTWNFTTAAAVASSSSSAASEERPRSGGGRGSSSPGRGAAAPVFDASTRTTAAESHAAASPEPSAGPPPPSFAASEPVRVIGPDGSAIVFLDVRTDDWFGYPVKRLVELNIFEGYKDMEGEPLGLYGPEDPITHGQLAKVGALLGGRQVEPVEGLSWAMPYIREAAKARFSVFMEETDPNAVVTRGAVIQTLLEALDIEIVEAALPYEDVPADSPHAAAIATATRLGIVSGDDGLGTFRPDQPVNRAEVAKMVLLVLDVAQTAQ